MCRRTGCYICRANGNQRERRMGSDIDLQGDRGAMREVPYMGVIFVVDEAHKRGFYNGHPDWSNLGQGQPEVGPMPGAPERVSRVELLPEDHAYGRLEGIDELREAVAAHYNRLYRSGRSSQYGPENVAIASGGRLALTRAMAALGPVNVGYQLPDYTAYEDMFNLHLGRLVPIPLRTTEEEGFLLDVARFESEIDRSGLGALIISNPCNPTGNVIAGEQLRAMVRSVSERRVTLLMDEFYSHFVYSPLGPGLDNVTGPAGGGMSSRGPDSDAAGGRVCGPAAAPVSAAAYVEDVERDPVVLFDGLTKCFRYPGWRVGWAVGPSAMVESIARNASSIDGGPSRPAQRAAVGVLAPRHADAETTALREVFCDKRNQMVAGLENIGVRFARRPLSTFYCWGSLAELEPPFNDAMEFFWRALDYRVMTVPGRFFDVNPGGLRRHGTPYNE